MLHALIRTRVLREAKVHRIRTDEVVSPHRYLLSQLRASEPLVFEVDGWPAVDARGDEAAGSQLDASGQTVSELLCDAVDPA